MNNTNNMSARMSYEHALNMFYRAFRDKFIPGPDGDKSCRDWVAQLKLSQGEVRLEVQLNTLNNNFTFGVTPNQTNTGNQQFVTERRLDLQNSLCVNEYGIYVANATSASDTEFALCSYGNPILFPTGATAIDQTFFANGSFQMKCNNDILVPYRGLFNHYYRPQTQQTAAIGAGSPGDQLRGAEDGMITDEPNIVLIGSKNYVPQIILPGALSAVDSGTRAVLIMRGIEAQNSTVVS